LHADSRRRNIELLEEFARQLRSRGIHLALVWMPVTPEYTADFGAAALTEQRALSQYLVDRDGVQFFDYSSDPRIIAEDFYNADHLNECGARKFSDILAVEVVHPLVAVVVPGDRLDDNRRLETANEGARK
jgi:hypothetical protein